MLLTGELSPSIGSLIIAREALWIGSIGNGMMDFGLELFSPEKRFRGMRWRRKGKIALDEDEEDEEEEVDGVEGLGGGGAVPGKNEYGEAESPVLTANIYERWVEVRVRGYFADIAYRLSFSWLTRELRSLFYETVLTHVLSYAVPRYQKSLLRFFPNEMSLIAAVPWRRRHVVSPTLRLRRIPLQPPRRLMATADLPRQVEEEVQSFPQDRYCPSLWFPLPYRRYPQSDI